MRRVLVSSLVAAVLAAAAAIPIAAYGAGWADSPQRPAAPRTTAPGSWTDFNGDGSGDLAIGAPFDDVAGLAGAGVVNVLYGSSTGLGTFNSQVWHQDRPNVANVAEAGDHFGWSLATGDFDGDTFADLAVGVPDEDIGATTDRGGISILYGSSGGLVARSSQLFLTDAAMPGGARLGYALTAMDARLNGSPTCTPGSDGIAELVGGAPGDGPNGEGSVRILVGAQVVSGAVTCGFAITKVVGGTAGAAAGRSLAAGDVTGDPIDEIVVGIPLEDDTSGPTPVLDTGAVVLLGGASFDTIARWEQGSELGDAAEANDRVGEAVAMADIDGNGIDEVAIGVPREDLPGGADAGVVQVKFNLTGAALLYQEGSGGVPGVLSAGDRFGSSLAFGSFEGAGSPMSLAIGVPGDDVAGLARAGAVVVIYNDGGGLGTTDNDRWHQNVAGILDQAEAGDRFGSTLLGSDFDDDGDMDLAIGAPREDVGSVSDAGAVAVLYAGASAADDGLGPVGDDLWHQDVSGIGEVAQAGDRFGAGLP